MTRHGATGLNQQIRRCTCGQCDGVPFTPVFEGQTQCCIPGFERKEVAALPLPPRRPMAYETIMVRRCPICRKHVRKGRIHCSQAHANMSRTGMTYAKTEIPHREPSAVAKQARAAHSKLTRFQRYWQAIQGEAES